MYFSDLSGFYFVFRSEIQFLHYIYFQILSCNIKKLHAGHEETMILEVALEKLTYKMQKKKSQTNTCYKGVDNQIAESYIMRKSLTERMKYFREKVTRY